MGKKKSNKVKTVKNNETKSKKLIGNIICFDGHFFIVKN